METIGETLGNYIFENFTMPGRKTTTPTRIRLLPPFYSLQTLTRKLFTKKSTFTYLS